MKKIAILILFFTFAFFVHISSVKALIFRHDVCQRDHCVSKTCGQTETCTNLCFSDSDCGGGGGGGGGGGPTATSAPAATATPVPGATCPWSSAISASTLPGSGAIQTQAEVIYPNNTQMLQTFYRGDQGYWRIIPVSGGNPVWASAGAWSAPISASTLPGSGTIQTNSNFTIGNGANLVQAIWRGDQGFTRTVPISGGVPQWGCANGSPTATPIPSKCEDPPACLFVRPHPCNPPEPEGGWCPITPTVTPIPPTATPAPGCTKKSQGDADCDDNITLKDYFYYVSKKAGAVLPPTVNVDFNASGAVDDADRTIVVGTLKNVK